MLTKLFCGLGIVTFAAMMLGLMLPDPDKARRADSREAQDAERARLRAAAASRKSGGAS
jgi:hypothetical protein